jgi:hypothetical protein
VARTPTTRRHAGQLESGEGRNQNSVRAILYFRLRQSRLHAMTMPAFPCTPPFLAELFPWCALSRQPTISLLSSRGNPRFIPFNCGEDERYPRYSLISRDISPWRARARASERASALHHRDSDFSRRVKNYPGKFTPSEGGVSCPDSADDRSSSPSISFSARVCSRNRRLTKRMK